MNQLVVNILPTMSTTTPIYYYKPSLLKLSPVRLFSQSSCSCPNKESNSTWSLYTTYASSSFFFFFFQGKALEEDPFRSLKKERMSKSPFFFNLHLNGSPSSFRGICNSNWWRKTPTNSTPQSLTQCWNRTSHLRTSPIFCLTKTSSTNTSLFNAISNKSETQFQRLISTPPILWKPYSLPYANQICFEKSSQPILILHHKPHACEPLPSFEQHPPFPNFEATISLHNQVSSAPKHPTISPTKL